MLFKRLAPKNGELLGSDKPLDADGGGYVLGPFRPDAPLPELSDEPEVQNAAPDRLAEAIGATLARKADVQTRDCN